MKNLLFAIILIASFGAKAQMSIDKIDNYSKCICTVQKLNAEKWNANMMDINGIQLINSENYTIEIDWQFTTIEISRKEWKFIKKNEAGKQVLILFNHPEIEKLEVSCDTEGRITELKFIEK